jgi:hypothetical protein
LPEAEAAIALIAIALIAIALIAIAVTAMAVRMASMVQAGSRSMGRQWRRSAAVDVAG